MLIFLFVLFTVLLLVSFFSVNSFLFYFVFFRVEEEIEARQERTLNLKQILFLCKFSCSFAAANNNVNVNADVDVG